MRSNYKMANWTTCAGIFLITAANEFIKRKEKGASTRKYVSPNQLTLYGFKIPLPKLTNTNRLVKHSRLAFPLIQS